MVLRSVYAELASRAILSRRDPKCAVGAHDGNHGPVRRDSHVASSSLSSLARRRSAARVRDDWKLDVARKLGPRYPLGTFVATAGASRLAGWHYHCPPVYQHRFSSSDPIRALSFRSEGE